MQDTATASEKINGQNGSSFLIKMYDDVLQIKEAIILDKELAHFKLNFTVLVKLSETHSVDDSYKLNLKNRIDKSATSAIFNNPNVGSIYSIGLLTNMFMQMVGKKVLGSMDGGLYGILRGLEVNESCAADCVNKLIEGKYMLITSGDPQDIKKLKQRFGNNCQG